VISSITVAGGVYLLAGRLLHLREINELFRAVFKR
jgi:hypothetical protein